ncbi:MAG: ABC transporter permease [Candidatus Bathyarchaeota archaeon]|nr:ABC transporter permease [Candidatus Bathyarchaeota archaeon]
MKVSDVFSYAFGAIRLRKLRAGLTTLGVVIGIAAIVALLSISQGLQDSITEQLQTGFATNTLIVSTGGGFGMGPGAMTATESDFNLLVNYTQIIDEIEDVVMSVAVIQKPGCHIRSGERELKLTVVGVDFAKYANIYSSTFEAESGEIPLDPENETVVVGKRVSDPWKNGTLFCDVDDGVEIVWTTGTLFDAKNETYTGHVAAVLKEIGGFGIGPSDSSVYIPILQAQSFFGTDECDTIIVQLENDDEATIESVSEAIDGAFSGQVSVTSSTAMLDIMSSVFSTVELFLAGIAAISLLVAGIGIMNIMIVSLMERTREIGILKALGMKSRTVLSIFLSEAVIVGLMGAAIGIASGWGLAHVVARVFSGGGGFMPAGDHAAAAGGMTITPVLTPTVFLGAFAFGLIVSVVFALYPAWRASKLKPVEALRYE